MTFAQRNAVQARIARRISSVLPVADYTALRVVGVVFANLERVVRLF